MNEKLEMQAMLQAQEWALEIAFSKLKELGATGVSDTARAIVASKLTVERDALCQRALELLDDIIHPAV